MSYKTIETLRFHWRWKEFGTGSRLMLAFHGFNRGPDDFHSFEKWLGTEYRILAFELFFHGNSYVKGDESLPCFSREELKEVVEKVLDSYGCHEFEVMSHSFGSRLALNCVEIMGERMRGIYLMAPDAMRFNPGYWFATHTALGRMIMRRHQNNPGLVVMFMQLLGKLGLYDAKAIEFYINQVTFGPIREKVYKIWMAHRASVVNRKAVARLIRKYRLPLLLFFGKYDSVIPPALGARFAKLCGETATLHIIDTGHRIPEKHHEISEIILNCHPQLKAQKNRPVGDWGGSKP